MKIAIDGPSASGKGELTKNLSRKLGLVYLNTGKIYRVVAMEVDIGNMTESAITASQDIQKCLDLHGKRDEIYSTTNSALTSQIAIIPQVRKNLNKFQQEFIKNNDNIILEGRDTGTVIMPNADFKFFITATTEERAKRRVKQNAENGINENHEEILLSIKERDERDKNRKTNPLVPAEDAIIIDNTNMTKEECFAEILSYIQKKMVHPEGIEPTTFTFGG